MRSRRTRCHEIVLECALGNGSEAFKPRQDVDARDAVLLEEALRISIGCENHNVVPALEQVEHIREQKIAHGLAAGDDHKHRGHVAGKRVARLLLGHKGRKVASLGPAFLTEALHLTGDRAPHRFHDRPNTANAPAEIPREGSGDADEEHERCQHTSRGPSHANPLKIAAITAKISGYEPYALPPPITASAPRHGYARRLQSAVFTHFARSLPVLPAVEIDATARQQPVE